ncbi:MAG: hypothetical protein J6Y38_00160 [Bacteroidaceae bacterium]|nr:hypothetical protein [Bacteroidaceae bacterium]
MQESEAKEFLAMLEGLEKAGWHPMLCDTPVPYYDNEVMCGVPNGVGDVVTEVRMLPKELLAMQPEFMVKAKGDSMKGAGIDEGDTLHVVTDVAVTDGDIVLALLDDEYTIKTYCEDDDGHAWLVPQNEDYEPIRMEDYDGVTLVGVVRKVTKRAPRVKYRECMRLINNAKRERNRQRRIAPKRVSHAIREIAPMVEVARQWYAVCRVLEDVKVVSEDDFDGFCQWVRSEVPEHPHLPVRDEIMRMAAQSFKKPVAMWNELNAPVQGKRFKDYVKIAERMKELLEEM